MVGVLCMIGCCIARSQTLKCDQKGIHVYYFWCIELFGIEQQYIQSALH